jgi:uncharacterized protein with von Willebrand factor type A (vWA) domain
VRQVSGHSDAMLSSSMGMLSRTRQRRLLQQARGQADVRYLLRSAVMHTGVPF